MQPDSLLCNIPLYRLPKCLLKIFVPSDWKPQLEKLKNYSCDEIYQEKISGIREDRSELNKLLGRLRKGDKIVVQRLDCLGRRMSKLIELINNFKEKEIEFVALEK